MKPPIISLPTLLLVASAWFLGSTSSVQAAQDVSEFSRTTSPLTSTQKQQLRTFITTGTRGLASDDPQQVMTARNELIEVLTRVGTSPVFREAFGETFVADARSIFENGTPFNTHNAFRVVAHIQTGDSNEFLAKQISPENRQNLADRVFASNMLALSLRATNPSLIRPRQYNSIIRSITSGAKQETSWAVLLHEFESLVAISANPDVPEDIRSAAIRSQSEVLKTTVDRIGEGKAVELSRSVSPIVLMLRTEFIGLEGPIRRTFAESMLPSLTSIFGAGERGWDTLHQDSRTATIYGDAIFQATVVTRLVVGSNEAPSSDPAQAWRDRQQTKFNESAQQWIQLAKP